MVYLWEALFYSFGDRRLHSPCRYESYDISKAEGLTALSVIISGTGSLFNNLRSLFNLTTGLQFLAVEDLQHPFFFVEYASYDFVTPSLQIYFISYLQTSVLRYF
jgi:hypothetical protein